MRRWDVLVVCVGVALLFVIQVIHLDTAMNTMSDEGVHAEVGRMLLHGLMPYRDFSYLHPPLLSAFTATIFWVSGGEMFWVRLAYLILNCAAVFPLYAVLKRVGGKIPALVAIGFYLTYYHLVFDAFRMLATRPFANVFLIFFLYATLVMSTSLKRLLLQWASALLAMLTLFPSAIALTAFSCAAIWMESRKRRVAALRRYVWLGLAVLIPLSLLFLIPRSFERLLLFHLTTGRTALQWRLENMFSPHGFNFIFHVSAVVGLLTAIVSLPKQRAWAIAMSTVILAIFLPSEFFDSYVVAAAIPFTWGVMLLVHAVTVHARTLGWFLLLTQWLWTLPTLVPYWLNNQGQTFWPIVEEMRTMPEPVLTFFEPIYAIEAHKELVQQYYRAGRQSYEPLPASFYREAAAKACTIALTPADQTQVPADVQASWKRQYRYLGKTNGMDFYLTGKVGCAPR